MTGLIRKFADQSVLLVFFCTIIGAAAQIFLKLGANRDQSTGAADLILNIVRSPTLFFGYTLYGISTALLILALKKGQLSILYPVISLTYVWVTVLSLLIFKETMNLAKLVGLMIVMMGVAVLGAGSKK